MFFLKFPPELNVNFSLSGKIKVTGTAHGLKKSNWMYFIHKLTECICGKMIWTNLQGLTTMVKTNTLLVDWNITKKWMILINYTKDFSVMAFDQNGCKFIMFATKGNIRDIFKKHLFVKSIWVGLQIFNGFYEKITKRNLCIFSEKWMMAVANIS